MPQVEIVPSFLVQSADEFKRKVRQTENVCPVGHVDILDGKMFNNQTWHDAHFAGSFESPMDFELHLMVNDPLPIVIEWARHCPQTIRAIIHAEIQCRFEPKYILDAIRECCELEIGIAINPATPLSQVQELLPTVDCLLVMGVHPGFSGQSFGGEVGHLALLDKIVTARRDFPDLNIEVDGGVNDLTLGSLVQAGANWLCAASLIFQAEDPEGKVIELHDRLAHLAK